MAWKCIARPRAGQPDDGLGEHRGVDHRQAGAVGRVPAAVQVRRRHRRGEVLRHAVLHDLDDVGGEPAGAHPAADQVLDLLQPAGAVPPQRAAHPGGERAGRRQPQVGVVRVRPAGVRPDGSVLPGRDAEGVQVRLGQQQGLAALLRRRRRGEVAHQRHRLLVQHPGRRAVRVALEAPARRVRGARVEAGELQRPAVGPGQVPVAGGQVDRPVGHDRVERLAPRQPAGEGRQVPAAAADPRRLRVLAGVRRHPVDVRLRARQPAQRAGQHLQAAPDRVHVRVLEPGHEQPAGQVDDLGARRRRARAPRRRRRQRPARPAPGRRWPGSAHRRRSRPGPRRAAGPSRRHPLRSRSRGRAGPACAATGRAGRRGRRRGPASGGSA